MLLKILVVIMLSRKNKMKKTEFIAFLKSLPGGDIPVLMSKDDEGNAYCQVSNGYSLVKTADGTDALIIYPDYAEVELSEDD
jgi:hypothetical protein